MSAGAPSSVLPTGAGAALIDPSDTLILLLDRQSGLFQTGEALYSVAPNYVALIESYQKAQEVAKIVRIKSRGNAITPRHQA